MDPLVEHHFYNIANDKAVKNEDGTLSTVKGTIVEIDGIQTLIPTIWDGKEVDTQTAIQNAQKSGVNWQRAFGDNAIEIEPLPMLESLVLTLQRLLLERFQHLVFQV